MNTYQSILKKTGKHILAIALFLVLVVIYFSPAILDGKVIHQSDMILSSGMGTSQAKQFAETAAPGEFSAWSDAMFGGMPYSATYGNPAPNLPGIHLIEKPVKSIGYTNASMVLAGLICFYILMCVMKVDWWLAVAGSIAFAFASYNLIIIEAGHITKAYVIAYMPITLAGMALLFKRKYLWGSILLLLGIAFSISNYHAQITYYLTLLCLFVYLVYFTGKIKEKEFKELGKVTAIMIACLLIAVLPNARNMYTQWELGKTSIRGATELTTTTAEGEKISSGLDKDYAFQWSYGKGELLTILIPNLYGGSSGGTLDRSSKFYKSLRSAGYAVGKEVQAPTYWGDKAFTSGPVYFGAVVCLLFVLGMFVIKSKIKWGLFAGAVFLTLLALGRNLDWFNTFIFHYLPLYNKFRTPEMALVIPGLVFPVIAFWGLKDIIAGKTDPQLLKKGLIWSLSITGGICLIVWWFPETFFRFQSDYDAQYQQLPWYDGLVSDRVSLASSDAFRSLLFILSGAGLLYFFLLSKNKKNAALIVSIGITLLTFADLWTVDKRYLNKKDFTTETEAELYKKSVADKEILQDPDISYRVFTLNNPFAETSVSYYHHSVGGYHAVKLRRYQELIDHRLSGELAAIKQAFQKPQVTLADIQQVFLSTPSLNMLNTRYVIYNPEQPPVVNPFTFGNAWFVSNVNIVENADAEIATLNTMDPLKTAVVDKRFSGELNGFIPQTDSTATIVLDSYRPNHLVYTAKTQSEQLALFSEIYYQPGWNVTVDGNPAPHFRADWILRAMLIPAGEHKIEFDFRPEGYVITSCISVYSSFLMLLFFILGIAYSFWRVWKQSRTND
jgi:hypothetical protein